MSVKSASRQSGGPKDGATTNVAVYLSVEHANSVLLTTAEILSRSSKRLSPRNQLIPRRRRSVNFRLPCENRLASDRRRTYIAPLGDFDPFLARRSRPWPGRDDVARARRRRKVREVRQHDHRHHRSSPAPAPHNYLLAGSKVGPDEVGVIDGQSRRGGSQLYQGLYVGVDTPTHQSIVTVGVALFVCAERCSQPAEVHRVHLLTRALSYVSVYIEKVMLVSKLLPGEKHWNPDRRHQANERQLDPLLDLLVGHPAL